MCQQNKHGHVIFKYIIITVIAYLLILWSKHISLIKSKVKLWFPEQSGVLKGIKR